MNYSSPYAESVFRSFPSLAASSGVIGKPQFAGVAAQQAAWRP